MTTRSTISFNFVSIVIFCMVVNLNISIFFSFVGKERQIGIFCLGPQELKFIKPPKNKGTKHRTLCNHNGPNADHYVTRIF